ncbi:MAG: ABC transporter permease [Spirochaetaceae bacterium]|jgi:ABC-2 type transport system permease protein|nr:ABC transporter permease [Spirochaetaceae bacterium]
MNQFLAMVKARTMEFVRDRGTFFWNLLFPLILVFGFSFVFSGNQDKIFKVGLLGDVPQSSQYSFLELEQAEFIPYDLEQIDRETVVQKLRMHQLDMLLDFDKNSYYINDQSANGKILRMLLQNPQYNQMALQEKEVSGKAIRYVDWLVPGVIGMNMLFSCMFGVGFVIVRYRKNGVLKRLKATPVSAFSFVSAQMASRFFIVLLTSMVVFAGTNIFLKFMMLGSYWNLILITALAILCMISLGLIFASRFKSEELASGVLNLLNFPMIIFSGVFFSLEGTPPLMQKIARFFPLTHFIEGARAIMLEGAGFVQILPNLITLAAMTLLFLVTASLLFQWD